MAEAKWYLARDEKALGPFTLAELKRMVTDGSMGRDDLVCSEEGSGWVTATTVPRLFPSPPRRPSGDRTSVPCEKCGAKLSEGAQSCPRCGPPRAVQQQPATVAADPVPDKYGFTGKLVAQTLGVWFAVGFFSGMCIEASCLGVPLVLGALAAALGAGVIGLLSLAQVADRWYLLRWVNHVLERVAAGAFIGGFVIFVLLVVAGACRCPGRGTTAPSRPRRYRASSFARPYCWASWPRWWSASFGRGAVCVTSICPPISRSSDHGPFGGAVWRLAVLEESRTSSPATGRAGLTTPVSRIVVC